MNIGIIYAYTDQNENVLYVGRTSGVYTSASALNARHKGHLVGGSPFDKVLQQMDSAEYKLKIITEIRTEFLWDLRPKIKAIERETILRMNPIYNVKFNKNRKGADD